ncbi:MAG: CoA transferase [Pseudomonadota bacterium]
MLADYRVLDLADERGVFCGYLLAHLGAQVLAIEPPGGSSVRSQAPAGAWWQAYARGKRSRGLDLETPAGREALHKLAREADFLIESYAPQRRAALGVDEATLRAINPRLIVVSISPFGGDGPKADWPATDLTVWAASGAHALAGDRDLAPVRTSVPQTFLHAGADAAGAALIALQERHRSGLGQHVDISAQVSCTQAVLSGFLGPMNQSELIITREAGGLASTFPVRLTWPCKNGYVAVTMLFGPAFSEPNRRLLRWVAEAGYCSADDAEMDWGIEIAAMIGAGKSPEPYFALCKQIEAFTLTRTREELFEEGLARGIYIAPTLDVAGMLDERHFRSRGYWQSNGAGARVPGPCAKFSAAPLAPPTDAPANVGGDGFSPLAPSQPATSSGAPRELPLKGLKVLDFMWIIAGPIFTRVLQDHGATVIRVESTSRLCAVRASPPFKNDVQDVANSAAFGNFNAGKMGITVDPSNPAGRELLLELVRWADVVTESFSPKAMREWGLDYETLKAENPDLIMLSSCLMGQSGDRAQMPGYGNMAAAIAGFYELTGWPERSPAGPYLAYTDAVSPRFMLASLMAALEHKRRTGEGQRIDLSQAEAAIHFLAPAIIDYETSGRVWQRMGNRDLALCPHGVFATSGDDEWIAIACQDDAAWTALCRLCVFDDWANDASLASASDRKAREDEIEARLAAWAAGRSAAAAQAALIEAGVAAHQVQNAHECWADAQLQTRDHFISVPHTSLGEMVVENSRYRLSATPAQVTHACPDMGEHNVAVLTDVLDYDADRMADLFASLALE